MSRPAVPPRAALSFLLSSLPACTAADTLTNPPGDARDAVLLYVKYEVMMTTRHIFSSGPLIFAELIKSLRRHVGYLLPFYADGENATVTKSQLLVFFIKIKIIKMDTQNWSQKFRDPDQPAGAWLKISRDEAEVPVQVVYV
jgi:hypothetical protein